MSLSHSNPPLAYNISKFIDGIVTKIYILVNFHIHTVHHDIIKVLFIHQLMH